MLNNIGGKVVVITGASSGLGEQPPGFNIPPASLPVATTSSPPPGTENRGSSWVLEFAPTSVIAIQH